MDAVDFCLHYDENQDKAYIFFERPHFELICADLTDDFPRQPVNIQPIF